MSAFVAAVAATGALSQVPVSGAFSGFTSNQANRATSAATFCTAAPTTLVPSGDSYAEEAAQTANHKNDLQLRVRSSATTATANPGDAYLWTRFPTQQVPARCDLVKATLRYYNVTPSPGRYVHVYRGAPSSTPWTSDSINWSTQPSAAGSAVTNGPTPSTAGWQEWVVTDLVLGQYAHGNNGFMLRDSEAHRSSAVEQVYYDLQNTTYTPTLVLTWR